MLKTLKRLFKDEKGIATIDAVILVGAIIAGGVAVGLVYHSSVSTAANSVNTNLQEVITMKDFFKEIIRDERGIATIDWT